MVAGFEDLHLCGSHVLLFLNSQGKLLRDATGDLPPKNWSRCYVSIRGKNVIGRQVHGSKKVLTGTNHQTTQRS
jgi:hypothetical protein